MNSYTVRRMATGTVRLTLGLAVLFVVIALATQSVLWAIPAMACLLALSFA